MVLDTLEKATAELETALFSMENSYVLGFCKDDVHYDDFRQPWVDYIDMHDYSDMHEYAYAGNEQFEDKLWERPGGCAGGPSVTMATRR
jgi:hypothetical protein